ncbi:hypothetical protein [Kitasatospora sp. NPDC088134]|uniref:hypothetical protein n=1 Tax=Kitasatospora sp. NPDC088134 TaxID=3364071 RepID=UPI003825843B
MNELSCTSDSEPREIDSAMAGFIATLKSLKDWQNISLVTRSPLPATELARGYVYQQWMHENPRNRDRHRFLLALRNRSPIREALPAACDPDEVEYLHRGQPAEALGAAHLTDGLTVSLPVCHPEWASSWLDADVRTLTEDGIEEVTVQVRHCSSPAEAEVHKAWALDAGLARLSTPESVLAAWQEFFPHLQFLPRFERDLRRLDLKWFRAVREMLVNLESTAAGWDPSLTPEPVWKHPHITPESSSRLKHVTFQDLDGERRPFSWHGRMTPGKGRLYFRLIPEERSIRLGFVGAKPDS